MTIAEQLGALYLIDGEVWRVCCVDSDGADLHKVNSWNTRHMTPEEWVAFQENNRPTGRYD